MLSDILKNYDIEQAQRKILDDLILFSDTEWIDIKNIRNRKVIIHRETLDHLKLAHPDHSATQYSVTFSVTETQRQEIDSYNKHYQKDDFSYYYNVFDVIRVRENLRYQSYKITLYC